MSDEPISIRDIEEELRKIKESLDNLEEKIKDRQWREVLTQVRIIIDDVQKLTKTVQEYDPLNDVSDEAIAEICIRKWGCKCPEG